MLASIRKFSSSIYAKIFLIIVAIPFVFWGMGPLFTGGNVNIVVVIDKEKHSTQDFVDYMQKFISAGQKINIEQIEEFLSLFISEKLIEKDFNDQAILIKWISRIGVNNIIVVVRLISSLSLLLCSYFPT